MDKVRHQVQEPQQPAGKMLSIVGNDQWRRSLDNDNPFLMPGISPSHVFKGSLLGMLDWLAKVPRQP